MKINNNCARKILLEIEKIPYGESMAIWKLQENLSEYSIDDVLNIVDIFHKDHFLNILNKASYDDNDILRDNKIKNLTNIGYRAVDNIRNDEIWNEIITKIEPETSFYTILDIANKINQYKQNQLFKLPDLLINNNSR